MFLLYRERKVVLCRVDRDAQVIEDFSFSCFVCGITHGGNRSNLTFSSLRAGCIHQNIYIFVGDRVTNQAYANVLAVCCIGTRKSASLCASGLRVWEFVGKKKIKLTRNLPTYVRRGTSVGFLAKRWPNNFLPVGTRRQQGILLKDTRLACVLGY